MCAAEVIHSVRDGAAGARDGTPDRAERASGSLSGSAAGLLARARSVQDLTHTLTAEFPVFPAYRPFAARSVATVEVDGYAARELCFAEHTGTHLDAPAHFFSEGETGDRVPVFRLVAPLVVVDIAERAAGDHDAVLAPDDLLAWEARFGRIPPGAVVALHSGWESRLADPASFLNADAHGVLHSPGFGSDAAEFLVGEREVAGVATDTMSLDIGASTAYEAHRVLLGAAKYGLENVAHLSRVPCAGAVLIVGAPKHGGATGGPARLLALF
jgi:kynurenine formamidase